jgi:hypothetical protein
MLSEWVSFLAYPNLFGIKGFVVVVEIIFLLPLVDEWACCYFSWHFTESAHGIEL